MQLLGILIRRCIYSDFYIPGYNVLLPLPLPPHATVEASSTALLSTMRLTTILWELLADPVIYLLLLQYFIVCLVCPGLLLTVHSSF
jgi:hypothetical protein